jgi:mRNA interferase MazF
VGGPARPDRVGAGLPRPVIVVQGDASDRSRVATVVGVSLTSNLRRADATGNVLLNARAAGLPRDSVANVTHVVAIDRALLSVRVGTLATRQLQLVLAGIDIVLGR